jgi:hypothetical protein
VFRDRGTQTERGNRLWANYLGRSSEPLPAPAQGRGDRTRLRTAQCAARERSGWQQNQGLLAAAGHRAHPRPEHGRSTRPHRPTPGAVMSTTAIGSTDATADARVRMAGCCRRSQRGCLGGSLVTQPTHQWRIWRRRFSARKPRTASTRSAPGSGTRTGPRGTPRIWSLSTPVKSCRFEQRSTGVDYNRQAQPSSEGGGTRTGPRGTPRIWSLSTPVKSCRFEQRSTGVDYNRQAQPSLNLGRFASSCEERNKRQRRRANE